jgi:protease-4
VVYAEGAIVDGEGGPGKVGGDRYAREIRKMRLDPSVKAIVLRVNSPGGSVFAAETIYQELKAAAAAKPLVVSFGTYAASGGYYIAAAGNRIFAEPTTITGSIGIFGLLFNFEKLASNNGIKTDSLTTTTPLASLFNPFVRKSDADIAILQKSVDRDYETFLEHVAEARRLTVEQVDQVAQGRVWSGLDARKVKLVDELGGLSAAMLYASKVTNLGDNPRIVEYPARKTLERKLQEILEATPRPPVSRLDPIQEGLKELESQAQNFRSLNDPQNVYALFPAQIRWN